MSSEYCCDKCAEESQCMRCGDREVKESQNGYCVPCWNEMFHEKMPSMSHESNHCPGCDEEITVGANGYCAGCWTERFGCEEVSTISYVDEDYELNAVIQIQNWWRKVSTRWYKEPKCDGCYFNYLNQQGHMGIGGCLYEPDPYEFE